MHACFNILRDPQIFFTATGFLMATQVLWTETWVHTHVMYMSTHVKNMSRDANRKQVDRESTVSIGFIWTFLTILLSLATFAFAVLKGIDKVAIGLFVTSFLMSGINVLQMTVITLLKFLFSQPLTEPAIIETKFWKKLIWFLALLVAIAGLGIVSFSIAGALGCCWGWIGIVGFGLAVIYMLARTIQSICKKND